MLADPAANAVPGAVLITSFVLSGTSFLALCRGRGQARPHQKKKKNAADYPMKGIYYPPFSARGLTEGPRPSRSSPSSASSRGLSRRLALIFAAACAVTGLTRYAAGWRVFGGREAQTFSNDFPDMAALASIPACAGRRLVQRKDLVHHRPDAPRRVKRPDMSDNCAAIAALAASDLGAGASSR